jgi:hypothetical protein
MKNIDNPTLRIHGPVDLLSAAPHLLGFAPVLSVVLIGLTHGVLVVTARTDITDVTEHGQYLTETVAAMVRGGSTQFVVAIFTDDAHVDEEATLPHADHR